MLCIPVAINASSARVLGSSGAGRVVAVFKRSSCRRALSSTFTFRCFSERPLNAISDVFHEAFLRQNTPNDPGEIDKFIELFWRDKDGGINYREFTRIFNRYKVQFEEEDRNERRSAEYVETEEITRLKKSIFEGRVELNEFIEALDHISIKRGILREDKL